MTTFESVEALWDPEWRTWKPPTNLGATKDTEETFLIASHLSRNREAGGEDKEDGDVEVNEALLTSQEITRLVELADTDWEGIVDNKDLAEDDEYPLDEEEPPDPNENPVHSLPTQSQNGLDGSPGYVSNAVSCDSLHNDRYQSSAWHRGTVPGHPSRRSP
jgi:DNA polymerase zeta